MGKKIILAFVTLMLVVLIGCGRKSAEKVTVIRFFNPQSLSEEIKITKQIIAKFEKDNPDIKVKYEYGGTPDKVLVEMAGGSPPDVYMAWTEIAPVAAKNALLALDEYVKKYRLNLDAYFPHAVEFSTYRGKLYSLPVTLHFLVIFYNKDIFEKAGISYPDGSWTWNDYYKIARELTCDFDNDGNRDQFGVQLGSLGPWLLSNQGYTVDIVRKRANVKSREVIGTMKFAYQLYRDACPTPSELKTFGGTVGVDLFISGKQGMFMAPVAYSSLFPEIKDFRWDIVPLPIPPSGKRINPSIDGICADYLAIPRRGKHPEEAFRFVKYYCGKEGMEILASHRRFVLPYKEMAYKTFVPPPEGIKCLTDVLEEPYAFDILHGCGDTRWREVVDTSSRWWELILLGRVDLDEGINEMEKEMNQQIEKLFGSGETP